MKQFYKTLMDKRGWTLTEIDEMDIHFYLELYQEKQEEKRVFIDQLI